MVLSVRTLTPLYPEFVVLLPVLAIFMLVQFLKYCFGLNKVERISLKTDQRKGGAAVSQVPFKIIIIPYRSKCNVIMRETDGK